MRILGIDPGLASAGWAVLEYDKDKLNDLVIPEGDSLFDKDKTYKPEILKYGMHKTDSKKRNSDRVWKHKTDMESIIKFYKPDYLAMEDQYSHLNPKTLKALSHVRGAYMFLASEYNLEVYLYAPTSVKKIMAGKGNAKKQAMIDSVNKYFHLELTKSEDDLADSIAVAMSYLLNKKKARKI